MLMLFALVCVWDDTTWTDVSTSQLFLYISTIVQIGRLNADMLNRSRDVLFVVYGAAR